MKTFIAFLTACLLTICAWGQNPSANFTANVTSGCSPLTVTFTDQSTGDPTNWNWEFSNGTLSSVQNPVVTFDNPGTYSVKLVVKSATGIDQIERINYITVSPSPRVSFQADLTLSCLPAVIHFTDLSSTPVGTLTSWLWTFGDGGTSTDQHPTHSYAATGFYTVSLTVTNSSGCQYTLTADNYIRVVGSVEADFGFTQPSSCQAPFSVSFQNQSSGPGTITYSWDFGNSLSSSATNPTTVYNAPGTYTVRLFGQSNLGCSGFIEKTITITSTVTDFTAPAAACTNQPVRFQNNSSSPPVSYFWRFGDGTTSAQISPLKTYLSPGTYTVTLINTYDNCTDSIKKTITIGRPAVNFMANDSTSCTAPLNVQFTAIAPGATAWSWDFGDGGTSTLQNPTHQYTAGGNYDVSLTVSTTAGCSSTRVNADFIRIGQPQVSINVPAGGCIPFTYDPAAVIDSPDPIASYQWDLGEPGAIFNVEDPPPYNYTSAGTFPVSLTVTTVSGCTVTTTVPDGVRTGTPPTVDFSYTPVNACANQEIQFTDLSVTTPGAEVEWLWHLGFGDTSHQQNPRYGPVDTLFPVSLIVSNNGCIRSRTQILHVQPPIARFKPSVNCITHEVTFNNTSIVDPTLTPTTYLWTMGDPANTQFTTRNIPPFNYPGLGEYTVTLVVQNGPCISQESATVRILDERADFTIDRNPVCKGENFTLAAINSDPDNIWQYNWSVGGTVFSNAGPVITHSIATPGTYNVQLSIIDLNGCSNTKSVSGYIRVGGPAAGFAPPATICMSNPVTFTDQSTSVSPIVNWHFNFGDGIQQNFSAPPFAHTYTQPGAYIPSLTVTDALGCTDTYTLPDALILANLKAGFRSETFYCPSKPLQFVDTSEGAGLSYLWTFGDGNTSTAQNPVNTYPAADADYTVSLQVTDISGCQVTETRTNYVRIRSPKPAFGIQDTVSICPPMRTTFTFGGSDYSSFFWDFGDGSTSTAQNPAHFYSGFGQYTPTLYVLGPGGCIDSAKASVSLYNSETYTQISYNPTTACNPGTVNFQLVTVPGIPFVFGFGDGTEISSGATSFSHVYGTPSLNSPYLRYLDPISGCSVKIGGGREIAIMGALPLFGQDRRTLCDNGPVVFKDFTVKNEPIISRNWDFGDGNTSTAQDPTHIFAAPGIYPVVLTVTTQSNCVSTYRDTVLVYRTPDPIITSRDTTCINITEAFSGSLAIADTLTNWEWDFGNGQTSALQNGTATYATPGNYTVQLTASNKIGCDDTETKTIHVVPPPTATAVQDPITIMAGGSTPLLMNYTGNIVSYTWAPALRLSCISCPEPVANPMTTTQYNVQIADAYGCTGRGNITVTVLCGKQNVFVPNTFSPNGDGQNEVFYPRGTGLFRVKSMTVFNRWGQVIFDRKDFAANDPSLGWDGTFLGKKASADVYVYMMEFLCDNNTVVPVKGNITLLR